MRPLSSNLCFALTISNFSPRPASSAVLIVPIMFCLRIQKARTCFFPSSFKGREGVGEVDGMLCLVLSTINLLSTHKAVPRYGNLVDGNLAKAWFVKVPKDCVSNWLLGFGNLTRKPLMQLSPSTITIFFGWGSQPECYNLSLPLNLFSWRPSA